MEKVAKFRYFGQTTHLEDTTKEEILLPRLGQHEAVLKKKTKKKKKKKKPNQQQRNTPI